MNEPRKSDSLVVPMKSPNKAGQPAAEAVEGRGLAKGNLRQQNAPRTQCRQGALSALERVCLGSNAPPWRHYLRREPDAVVKHVRIRGGGREQSRSLFRLPVDDARAFSRSRQRYQIVNSRYSWLWPVQR